MFPLPFWRMHESRLPMLARVARIALTSPASSTASERVFNLAGLVRSKRRARLSPSMTETCVKVGHFVRQERKNKKQ